MSDGRWHWLSSVFAGICIRCSGFKILNDSPHGHTHICINLLIDTESQFKFQSRSVSLRIFKPESRISMAGVNVCLLITVIMDLVKC